MFACENDQKEIVKMIIENRRKYGLLKLVALKKVSDVLLRKFEKNTKVINMIF